MRHYIWPSYEYPQILDYNGQPLWGVYEGESLCNLELMGNGSYTRYILVLPMWRVCTSNPIVC